MRRLKISSTLWVIACVSACLGVSVRAGQLRAWGLDYDGQVTKLSTGTDYVAIAAGDAHGLALRPDGRVVAWGQNDDGECDVPPDTYVAIGAGADFSLAIRANGSLAVWGNDAQGQVSRAPSGNDFVAVEGGEFFAVALKADGSIVAWGDDRWRQVSGAPVDRGFVAVVAGDDHAVALRSDGSLVSWGYWAATAGTPVTGSYVAVAAGGSFSVAVRNDGSLVWWGDDPFGYGLANVPAGNDYVDVAAGYLHCLALKKDGSVVGWGAGTRTDGHPHWGQANPPAGNDYKAIAAGLYFSLAVAGDAEVEVPAVADDFNDDRRADTWELYGNDLLSCWLEETNQRLELRATASAQGIEALYVGNGWRIDPANDFSARVDFHYAPLTDPGGWVVLGLAPDANSLSMRAIRFGAGCDRLYPYFWYEALDYAKQPMDFVERTEEDGVLYISYDAGLDELYLSGVGHGSENAWFVIPGVLQTAWAGRSVLLFLGGGSAGLQVNSGDAYLDNLVVEAGSVPRPTLDDVYRFWSPLTGRHFYTIDKAERDKLIDEYAAVWTFEHPVFKAATTPYAPELAPVYRFWSEKGQSHFYTIDEREKDKLVNEFAHVWAFEGVAFYAWPPETQPAETKPVYRFWKEKDNSHFYTMDEAERDKLLKEFAHVYTYEGAAFYAYGL